MMYDFCKENIKGITFFIVTKNAMNKLYCEISDRLQQAKTIPGTRSMYYFETACSLPINGKRISSDTNFSIYASFDKMDIETLAIPSENDCCLHVRIKQEYRINIRCSY